MARSPANGSKPAAMSSGTITGRASGERVQAHARGDVFSADLSLTTRGNRQSVAIRPQGNRGAAGVSSRSAGVGTAATAVAAHVRPRRCRVDLGQRTRRNSEASGPSPSRQRARSPALPACSSAAAAVPTPLAPTACAAPLSLCAAAASAARLPLRDALSISRCGLDRGVAEFAEQRIDRGLVVAEPGAEHAAVDRAAGRRAVRRRRGRCRRARPTASARACVRSRSMFTGLTR